MNNRLKMILGMISVFLIGVVPTSALGQPACPVVSISKMQINDPVSDALILNPALFVLPNHRQVHGYSGAVFDIFTDAHSLEVNSFREHLIYIKGNNLTIEGFTSFSTGDSLDSLEKTLNPYAQPVYEPGLVSYQTDSVNIEVHHQDEIITDFVISWINPYP